MSHCFCYSIGTAVPEHSISQQEAVELTRSLCCETEKQSRLVSAIYRRSTIQQRYTCIPSEIARTSGSAHSADQQLCRDNDSSESIVQRPNSSTAAVENATQTKPSTAERMQWYEQHAFPLAHQAARQALAKSAISTDAITHLVTVSCTGFYSPGLDVQLIEHLPLQSSTERIHVGFMGCHGAINGLRAANGICRADPSANVLLCAVELCSLHYHFDLSSERFVGNTLFADGAAATVLRGSRVDEEDAAIEIKAVGSYLIPDSRDAMSWRISDEGFAMTLSSKIPNIIAEHLRTWLTQWLAEHDQSIETIQNWIVHPGGPRVLDAVASCLQLPEDSLRFSRKILKDYGNMSSPTVLFILDEARKAQEKLGPSVMLGFGPGLSCEIALLQ